MPKRKSTKTPKVYRRPPLDLDTADELASFSDCAGMSYSEAVSYLLGLAKESNETAAQAGVGVRSEKDRK